MKKTKFCIITMMVAFTMGMITSCSDDEEETGGATTIIENNGTGAIFKGIKDKDGKSVQLDEFSYNGHSCKYYYNEQGRLNKMIETVGGVLRKPTSINYPFEVIYKETKDGYAYDWQTSIKLDGAGDITSYSTKELVTSTSNGGFKKLEEDVKFAYNYSKQIQKVEITRNITSSGFDRGNAETENGKFYYLIEFTWEEGILKEGKISSVINDKEDHNTFKFSKYTKKLTSNQMPFNMVNSGFMRNFAKSEQFFSFVPFIGFGNVDKEKGIPSDYASFSTNENGTISREGSCTYTYAESK